MTVAMPITIIRVAVLWLVYGFLGLQLCHADEPLPAEFVFVYTELECDKSNSAWAVMNKHSYLSIRATLRWHPVGGAEKEEIIVLSPQEKRAVGCAPDVQVVSAELMQF